MLKTSKILGLAIATILTASIAALTLSNQVFAQVHGVDNLQPIVFGLAAHETQQGKVLAGELGHLPLLSTGSSGGTGSGSTPGPIISVVHAAGFKINIPNILTGCPAFSELGGITSECEKSAASLSAPSTQTSSQVGGTQEVGRIPVNVCGNSVNIVGSLSPSFGNICKLGSTVTSGVLGHLGANLDTTPGGGTGSGSTLGSTAPSGGTGSAMQCITITLPDGTKLCVMGG